MGYEKILFITALAAFVLCMTGCFEQPGEVRTMPSNVWKFVDGDVTCYAQDNSIQACVYIPPGAPKSCRLDLKK